MEWRVCLASSILVLASGLVEKCDYCLVYRSKQPVDVDASLVIAEL
jgi:hypothetical protein